MARPIFETLRDIRAGGFLNEATSALSELVQAVNRTGKGGEVRLILRVKPASASSRTLMVDAEVAKKLPEPDREISVFFPTADGSLTKTDPSQMPLGLRPVGSSPPPDAPVDLETGEVLSSQSQPGGNA